jgi:subtilisin family serine protease
MVLVCRVLSKSRNASVSIRIREFLPLLVYLVAQAGPLPAVEAFVPNDPYFFTDNPAGFPGQWHLDKQTSGAAVDINVRGAWNRGLTGAGVTIGIVESGGAIYTHPDLIENYDSANSWDFFENDPDPLPADGENAAHATCVAGLACARGGNGIGVTGVAPFASFASLRAGNGDSSSFRDTVALQMQCDAFRYRSTGSNPTIDIKSYSMGEYGGYAANDYPVVADMAQAVIDSTQAGTIHVVIAQNFRLATGSPYDADANKKSLCHLPEAIAVTAVNGQGHFAEYSNYGACIVASVPSGETIWNGGLNLTTTDRPGDLGYNPNPGYDVSFPDRDYTCVFTGTSSAAPIMSGILALAKEAQPNLDTRFAKHLLAQTSRLTDPMDSTPMGGWTTNAAGFHFNNNYGFGIVDADALTLAATQYAGVTPLVAQATSMISVNDYLSDNDPTGISRTFSLSDTGSLEEVQVTLSLDCVERNDLEATLVSPSGVSSLLMYRSGSRRGDENFNLDWAFTSNAFWGENPAGTWTLTLRDVDGPSDYDGDGFATMWRGFSVTARCGSLVSVPEPQTLMMLAAGGMSLLGGWRRRRNPGRLDS